MLCFFFFSINTFFSLFVSGLQLDGTAAISHNQVLPAGYWWSLLYGTVIGLLCLLVCLVGAHIYAKATFIIFLVVIFVLLTIFISFFAVRPRVVTLPSSANSNTNGSGPGFPTTANFTGFKLDTLLGNLKGKVLLWCSQLLKLKFGGGQGLHLFTIICFFKKIFCCYYFSFSSNKSKCYLFLKYLVYLDFVAFIG